MKKILNNSVILLALLSFNFGYSWGTTGHRVIAEIAENHLSCKAKKNLKKQFNVKSMNEVFLKLARNIE